MRRKISSPSQSGSKRPKSGRVPLRCGSSEATVSLDGAHVERLSLSGVEVTRPSSDGVQSHGGIAVLLPYAGRVRRGVYEFEGRRFQLPISPDGHALHGFAKERRWNVVKRSSRSVALRSLLKGPGYPGVLDVTIRYSLSRDGFSTDCYVLNVGASNCPLTVGFHPYFLARTWKMATSGRVYRYALSDKYFPTGELETFLFGDIGPETRLDDIFRVSGTVRLEADGSSFVITRRRMPYLVVYNGNDKASVAVEPYSGLEDAYNNGVGITVLRRNQSFRCGYEIRRLS